MQSEYVQLNTPEKDRLHAQVFSSEQPKGIVLGIHGAIENGRIFYPKNGSRIAEFLQEHGYTFYAWDLRGRGKSTPKVSKSSTFNQSDIIINDLPSIFNYAAKKHTGIPIIWLTHSWGGVLTNSCLVRFPEISTRSVAQIHFGTKRRISVINLKRIFMLDVGWNAISRLLVKKYGYLPAKSIKMGSDDESAGTHKQSLEWIYRKQWIDSADGFDYGVAAQQDSLPPTLYLSAENDTVLGHRIDVEHFARESRGKETSFFHLGKKSDFRHDYDHINMLTHSDAESDIFPKVLSWMEKRIASSHSHS